MQTFARLSAMAHAGGVVLSRLHPWTWPGLGRLRKGSAGRRSRVLADSGVTAHGFVCADPAGRWIGTPRPSRSQSPPTAVSINAMAMTVYTSPSHLDFVVTGRWQEVGVLLLAKEMAQALRCTEHRRGLVDLLQMQGEFLMSERLRMGASLGALLGDAARIAVLQRIQVQRGYEARIASWNGAEFVLFGHREDAESWLRS